MSIATIEARRVHKKAVRDAKYKILEKQRNLRTILRAVRTYNEGGTIETSVSQIEVIEDAEDEVTSLDEVVEQLEIIEEMGDNEHDKHERLESRLAEESEDDERFSEAYDRNLLNNLKAIVDTFATLFIGESAQDLRDYAQERRQRESEWELRLRQESQQFQDNRSEKQQLFAANVDKVRDTNAINLRDHTRDNKPGQ